MDWKAKTATALTLASVVGVGGYVASNVDWSKSFVSDSSSGQSFEQTCANICKRFNYNQAAFDHYAETEAPGLWDMCESPCSEYVPLPTPSVPSSSVSPSCCKYCTVGKACGDTCIEATDMCYVSGGCACDR